MSNQSTQFFFNLLQPFSPPFVELCFQFTVHVSCPINLIGSLDFCEFSSYRLQTFDYGRLVHLRPSLLLRGRCTEQPMSRSVRTQGEKNPPFRSRRVIGVVGSK